MQSEKIPRTMHKKKRKKEKPLTTYPLNCIFDALDLDADLSLDGVHAFGSCV